MMVSGMYGRGFRDPGRSLFIEFISCNRMPLIPVKIYSKSCVRCSFIRKYLKAFVLAVGVAVGFPSASTPSMISRAEPP